MTEANVLIAALSLYSIFALTKFLFFFVLNYRRRREMLDRAYQGKSSATKTADRVLLCIVLLLVALVYIRGVEHVSFLAGLLIGMTLIQLYFHQFSVPLMPSEEAPGHASPIKTISYAIQARPARPWKEMVVIAALLIASLGQIWFARH